VGVLVFDGLMVERDEAKGELGEEVLQGASDYIFNATGYRVQLLVKDMTTFKLDVPACAYTRIDCQPVEPLYAVDDHQAARLFISKYQGEVVSCCGRIVVKSGNMWITDKDLVDKALLARCMALNIMLVNDKGVARPMSANIPGADRIVKAVKALLAEPEYDDDPTFLERMWLSLVGMLPFRDGVWDFRARRFYTYEERPDVYPPFCLPRNFPERPAEEFMREVSSPVSAHAGRHARHA
jgi:hypothetical protein